MHPIRDFLPFQRLFRGEPPLHGRARRGHDPAEPLAAHAREVFDQFVTLRCHDHTRWEGGVALVRLGVRPGTHLPALQRALETELRRTDAICRDHDGSWLLLLARADAEIAELVAERVLIAVQELDGDARSAMFRIAVATAGGHAMDPDSLWEHLEDAWAQQDWTLGLQLVVRRHLDS